VDELDAHASRRRTTLLETSLKHEARRISFCLRWRKNRSISSAIWLCARCANRFKPFGFKIVLALTEVAATGLSIVGAAGTKELAAHTEQSRRAIMTSPVAVFGAT